MSGPQEPATVTGAVREAVDVARFPWMRPLVRAYAHDFPSVASLFAGNPADEQAWAATIARVQRHAEGREATAAVVARQQDARQSPPAAREAARRLADPRSVAIVTGQQATVFGGPLYTLLKAVTAIQLARRVERTHGVPVVPVFWVDAEDHDWEEVRSAAVLDRDGAPSTLSLRPVSGAGTKPVGSLVLDDGITEMIAALEQTLPPSEFTAPAMTALRARYRPGTSVAVACAGWLEDLLGHHGLVVFVADDPAAKPQVADLFVRELREPSCAASLALKGANEMRQLGHAPQVEPAPDAVCLFYLDEQGRRSIKRRPSGFAIGEDERDGESLVREATEHPERFGPNVLLRPLVQDRLFPTICYVAGPSELAYQAQLKHVYARFDVEPPLLYSRVSATFLDSAAVKFFDRYHLPIEALQSQDDSALNRLLESQLPEQFEQTFNDIDRSLSGRVGALKAIASAVDPTLTGTVDTTMDRLRDTLKTLQAKIIQASKKKDETLRRQFNRTRALTFPLGTPQERALSMLFFVNRYGLGLGDRLITELPDQTGSHYIVVL